MISTPPPNIDAPPRRNRLLVAFWIWYASAAAICVISPEGRVFLGAIGLGVIWFLVLLFRAQLQRLVSRITGPPLLKFILSGVVFADVIMENFAISFHGDLHGNLLLNSFLWLGAYLGWLAGWWLVGRRYEYTYQQVFFTAGSMGILVEQNWMIPKLLISLQLFPVLISVPILLVVYGTAVAPVFLLSPPPPHPSIRGFGFAAYFLGVLLPLALFLSVGHFWIAAFRKILG